MAAMAADARRNGQPSTLTVGSAVRLRRDGTTGVVTDVDTQSCRYLVAVDGVSSWHSRLRLDVVVSA
jgi:hypothetical protein